MTSNPLLSLSIARDSEVPLATQLAWKLRALVATGVLAPGDRLPGVREVAEQAAVNVNTVRSVYRRLEDEGLISSQHGRGTFVAASAAASDPLARIAAAAADEARRAGLDTREVAAALFAGVPAAASAPVAATADRARRRALRAEIARLESELAQLEGLSAHPLAPHPERAGQILGAPELETIRDQLVSRVAALRSERAQARSQVEARRAASAAPAPRTPGGTRVWRPHGAWTGAAPGGIVYES